MRFEALAIAGAFRLVPERKPDERGFFARTFCEEELEMRGLVTRFAQSSVSFNERRGTVRGMHYSAPPYAETKIVRCTAGEIHDALVDLRPASPTFRRTTSLRLSADNRHAAYVPTGVAHGFQTLADSVEVLYMIDIPYALAAARGLRWDDPAMAITWPEPVGMISERDTAYPDWRPDPAVR